MPDSGSRGLGPHTLNRYGVPDVVGHTGGVYTAARVWFGLDDSELTVWWCVPDHGFHLERVATTDLPQRLVDRLTRAADASRVANLASERPKVGR